MDPMHKFERVIKIIVAVIILVFASLLIARIAQAQMSPYDDELSQQLRGVRSPVLSADGRFVSYVRSTTNAATKSVSSDIVIVSVSDRKDVTAFPGSAPRWTADGAEVAALPTDIAWSADRAVKFVLSRDRDGAQLASVRDGMTTALFRCACSLSQLSVDRAGTLAAFVRSSNTEPPDVWTIALTTGATAKPFTRVNARVVLEALMTEAETFAVPGVNGTAKPMRVIPPASLERGHVYPTIVRIVDSAESVYAFDDRAQLWSTRGSGVLLLRVRDGANTVDTVHEVAAAVDAAITRYPWIDSTRIGLFGAASHSAMVTALLAPPTRFKLVTPPR